MIVLYTAVNCGSSLGTRAYANGAPTYPSERATTQLVCSSGYVWSTGESGSTAKTATCNDIGSGYGSWITNGECVGKCNVSLLHRRLVTQNLGIFHYF